MIGPARRYNARAGQLQRLPGVRRVEGADADRPETRRPADIRSDDYECVRESREHRPTAAAAGATGRPAPGARRRHHPPAPRRPLRRSNSEKLADGVYRITGGYVALAVEFTDQVVELEGGQPLTKADLLALLKEAK